MPLQYIGEPYARIQFDNVSATPDSYAVIIYKRDYTGDVTDLIGAATPAILRYDTDDPFAPIQGSILEFNYIHKTSFPVSNFYGENDTDFQVELTRNGTSIWVGWLQQDDVSELLVEYNHDVRLTAQCGLGFLRNVRLDQAMKAANNPLLSTDADELTYHHVTDFVKFCMGATGQETDFVFYANLFTNPEPYNMPATINAVAGNRITFLNTPIRVFNIGDQFSITGGLNAGTYTVTAVDQSGNDAVIDVAETTVLETGAAVTVNLMLRQWLFDNIIKATSFNPDDAQWASVYDVLERLLRRIRASVFMDGSKWHVIRWDELRYYAGQAIPGRQYSQTLAEPTAYPTYPGVTGSNLYLAGLSQRLFRPNKYAREQFNYVQPGQVLRNFDLQQLGDLITSYVVGSTTVYEYEFKWWSKGQIPETALAFIRVVRDTTTGTELERYVVINGTVFDGPRTWASFPIEGNKGDVVKFTFDVRTTNSIPGQGSRVFAVSLDDGVAPLYVDEVNGRWKSTVGFNFDILVGDNFNEWHTVTIKSAPLPHDGLIYCFISGFHSSGNETRYRDLRFEYIRVVSESTKITGHVHRTEQARDIKNNLNIDIQIDTAPSNNIAGNLFLRKKPAPNVVEVKPRTTLWMRGHNMDGVNLGNITTFEQILWRLNQRVIVEGARYGSASNVSKLRALTVPHFPNKVFISGRMEIDFRNNTTSVTLYELFDTTEEWPTEFELTAPCQFIASTDTINIIVAPGQYFFRVGDQYEITGTASNNLTFTVTGIQRLPPSDSYIISTDAAFTNETATAATFKALDNSGWIIDRDLYTFTYLYGAQ
jgi:hypothetical protein